MSKGANRMDLRERQEDIMTGVIEEVAERIDAYYNYGRFHNIAAIR
jgi:hypothetical protein